MRPGVFLDRDGVLIDGPVIDGRPYPPGRLDEVRILSGVVEACRRLRDAGAVLVMVTNQPDIARGAATASFVATVNDYLVERLGLHDARVCPHDDDDLCSCRKPLPGMLLDAASAHQIDLARSVMIGDRWRDVDAGRAAGARTIFIDRGYDERQPEQPDHIAADLASAVPFVLAAMDDPLAPEVRP